MDVELIRNQIAKIPGLCNTDGIIAAIESMGSDYHPENHAIPVPSWRTSGFDVDPRTTRDIILHESGRYQGNLSIYVHIPFCQTKCGFCDCFSVAETNNLHMERYVNILLDEITVWRQIPKICDKHVSVIHFGGGSPNYLPIVQLERILTALADVFNITPDTHIYMECNPVYFSRDYLSFLRESGVVRISVGVQTLQEPLRLDIGRKQNSAAVLASLHTLLEMGFIVSADLLYGLPEESFTEFSGSAQKLVNQGLHGISLYPFVISEKNRNFIDNNYPGFSKNVIREFTFFYSIHQMLLDNGFSKSFFLHFAKAGDDNLYYRHLLRMEDLVALGASADGIVGNYRFRNPILRDYMRLGQRYAGHQGGVMERGRDTAGQRAITELMAGSLSAATASLLGRPELIRKWQQHGLLESINEGIYQLTAAGSWVVNRMHNEVGNDIK